jgi:hypothetical protein
MAGNKYLSLSSGEIAEVVSTQTSAGGSDANKIVALDSNGKLDTTLMPTGIGADTSSIEASENLAASDFVNVHDSSGQKVRKADASGGLAKRAHGFVLASVLSGANATVYFEGTVSGLSGLTPGATYYLTGVAGTANTTGPTTATHIHQNLGVAVSNSAISFEPQRPVVLA